VFRRSEGSAPLEFVLIAAPLLLSFNAVVSITVLGYQKSLLIAAATNIAERSALADVTQTDEEELVADALAGLGLQEVAFSLSSEGGVKVARASMLAFGVFEIEAVGFASIEV
jgi:Flp pilus assembly protein TadG